MQTRVKLVAAAAALMIPALPALSHHSNSAYQVDQIITLRGHRQRVALGESAHLAVRSSVEGEDGKQQEWAVEGRPPGILGRAGWNSTVLKPGETVTVHASPGEERRPRWASSRA